MLELWSDTEHKQWAESRKQGYRRYMLRIALPCGIGMFVLNSLVTWSIFVTDNNSIAVFLLINAVVWAIAGFVLGHLLWRSKEHCFLKRESQITNNNQNDN